MIDRSDVVTMMVPFPNINSGLAVQAHMYICIGNGTNKEFIKCQRFKPKHINKKIPPRVRIEEEADINRNPFSTKTIIDCDKSFYIRNIIINSDLLATKRKDICEELYSEITQTINHETFSKNEIDLQQFLSLNRKIQTGV